MSQVLTKRLRQIGYNVEAPGRNVLNLTDRDSIQRFFENTTLNTGYDLLICNAGITRDKAFYQSSIFDFSEVLEVILNGHFLVAKHAARLMAKKRMGHIVFIGSYAAKIGTAGQSTYAAAKAALHGLAMSLAKEYGGRSVRVNVVLPGFMETKMTAELSDTQRVTFREAHALGEFNTPECVANFIAFLDQEMPFTSGQIFNLDSRIHRWS